MTYVASVGVVNLLESRDGTIDLKSYMSVMLAFSIVSAVTTETATGTSCKVFSVFVAVTMTSSTVSCAYA